jgi:hypothetical protein
MSGGLPRSTARRLPLEASRRKPYRSQAGTRRTPQRNRHPLSRRRACRRRPPQGSPLRRYPGIRPQRCTVSHRSKRRQPRGAVLDCTRCCIPRAAIRLSAAKQPVSLDVTNADYLLVTAAIGGRGRMRAQAALPIRTNCRSDYSVPVHPAGLAARWPRDAGRNSWLAVPSNIHSERRCVARSRHGPPAVPVARVVKRWISYSGTRSRLAADLRGVFPNGLLSILCVQVVDHAARV